MKPSTKSKSKREITSFVRRAGRMTAGQRNAWESYWNLYGIKDKENLDNITNLFDNNNKELILEIGFGDGKILIDNALRYPNYNFIGIEVYESGIGNCLLHLYENNLKNVKLIYDDAKKILIKKFRKQSINQVNIFFPDPWPKKKHHKRRLINNEFILLLQKKLKPNGHINVATDWDHYAEQILDLFEESESFKKTKEVYINPETKFEKRGLKLGHKIQKFSFQLI